MKAKQSLITIKNWKKMTEKKKNMTQKEIEAKARGWDFHNHYWIDHMSRVWRFMIDSYWQFILIEIFKSDEAGQLQSIYYEKHKIENQFALLNIALSQGGYVNGDSILTHHTILVKLNWQEENLILKKGKQVEYDELFPLV